MTQPLAWFWRGFLVFIVMAFVPFHAAARQNIDQAIETGPNARLEDAQLEARARDIAKNLRCPTCVSQSVDSSNVGISQDLKALVRERLVAGDSDQEIYDYIAQRYGDFVLLKPRFSINNGVLWVSPILLLVLVGGYLIVRTVKKKRKTTNDASINEESKMALSKAEEEELSSLLESNWTLK